MLRVVRERFLLLCCILWLDCLGGFAQLRGVVVDAKTGEPVAAATVAYRDGKDLAIADTAGCFRVVRVENGILTITSIPCSLEFRGMSS